MQVTFYHPVMETVECVEGCLLLVAFILGVIICNELEA